MLVRIWSSKNSHILLVGIQIDIATLENSVPLSNKAKDGHTLWFQPFSPYVLNKNTFICFFGGPRRAACGILVPDQRSNLCPLQWKRRVFTTEPPGKSLYSYVDQNIAIHNIQELETTQMSPNKRMDTKWWYVHTTDSHGMVKMNYGCSDQELNLIDMTLRGKASCRSIKYITGNPKTCTTKPHIVGTVTICNKK